MRHIARAHTQRVHDLKQAVTGLAVALLTSTAALALTLLLDPLVHQSVFVLFLGAVTLSAWVGGLGPGLVATALGGLAFSLYLTEPAYSLVVSGSGIATDLAIFGMVSVLINGLYVRLRRMRRREQAARCAAAHDLTNPLTAILGICQLLNRRRGYAQGHDPERCVNAILGIENNARRLAAQIEQLLDVACTEAGRPLGLRLTPTDVVALVDKVVAARSQSSLPPAALQRVAPQDQSVPDGSPARDTRPPAADPTEHQPRCPPAQRHGFRPPRTR
jgi:K+-sensing histidine kinase KdpD